MTLPRRLLPWIMLLLKTIEVHAAPSIRAPEPPAVVYRVDMRAPQTIFQEGLRTWASNFGDTTDTDLLSHVMGEYMDEDPINTTNWVSTTGSFPMAEAILRFIGLAEDEPEHIWMYDIQPTPQAYYVPWAFTDFLLRNPASSSERAEVVAESLDLFGDQEEWSFRGSIPPQAIIQARRYDRSETGYEDSGVRILNPAHQSQTTPARQTVNPLDGYSPEVPGSVIALGYEPLAPRHANGTMHEPPISVGMSCLGVAANTSASPRKKRATASSGYCHKDLQHVMALRPYTQLRYSPLAFTLHTGSTYCAWPYVFSSFYGVSLDSCAKAPRFLYDEHNRLYIRTHGIDWCMAVSPSVVDRGRDAWDYVKLEPCALNSIYQKWHIVDGKIYTHKGHYPVQDWMWGLIVSRRKDGYDNRLDTARMNADFFKGPSPSQSRQAELQMGWRWGGTTYYSTFNASGAWGTNYWNRSYYDYKTQRISYIDLSAVSTGFSPSPALKYCLRSLLASYTWNWTAWDPCRDDKTSPPSAQQWAMKSIVDAYNHPERVEWVSKSTSPSPRPEKLWVQATGQNAGQYFSATQGTWRNATHFFSVRKDAIRFPSLGNQLIHVSQ